MTFVTYFLTRVPSVEYCQMNLVVVGGKKLTGLIMSHQTEPRRFAFPQTHRRSHCTRPNQQVHLPPSSEHKAPDSEHPVPGEVTLPLGWSLLLSLLKGDFNHDFMSRLKKKCFEGDTLL